MTLNLDKISQEELNSINEAVCLKIDELLALLELDLQNYGKYYIGACPIHGGDNLTALNLYPNGYRVPGYWVCQTKHCNTEFAQNVIGFTRGVFSHKKCKWSKAGDKKYSFKNTVAFLLDFIGNKLSIDYSVLDKKRFIEEVEIITARTKPKAENRLSRQNVRQLLKIPAEYYLNRGYSKDILDRYDVGLCTAPNKQMYNRIVVPVYDDKFTLVGCQGRSIFEQCDKCQGYHNPLNNCPNYTISKWKNSDNFEVDEYLYNLWYARKKIEETKTVILVEGPGDVWRLEEAGIHNSVALMSNKLTEKQEIILETLGITNIVIFTDNDDGGKYAAESIIEKCGKLYNIFRLVPEEGQDVGKLTIDLLKDKYAIKINDFIKRYRIV